MIAGEEASYAFGVLPSHCIDHFFSLLGFSIGLAHHIDFQT
jgi:hypothetical protein